MQILTAVSNSILIDLEDLKGGHTQSGCAGDPSTTGDTECLWDGYSAAIQSVQEALKTGPASQPALFSLCKFFTVLVISLRVSCS